MVSAHEIHRHLEPCCAVSMSYVISIMTDFQKHYVNHNVCSALLMLEMSKHEHKITRFISFCIKKVHDRYQRSAIGFSVTNHLHKQD